MEVKEISKIIGVLQKETAQFSLPSVSQIALPENERPFRVLISCILSLRTKDEVTFPASERLFARAKNMREMAKLAPKEIERIIYPVGFYRNKAKQIPEICRRLMAEFGGKVPDEIDELLKLKGVGRKTANLVRTLGYGKPGICVDTHVHRISNRFGLVKTKEPNATEFRLREILPERYWIDYNDLLVTWGQNVCKPISPLCSRCAIEKFCPRVGVGKSR
ncbi:MAG: endonuclease III [bacterium]